MDTYHSFEQIFNRSVGVGVGVEDGGCCLGRGLLHGGAPLPPLSAARAATASASTAENGGHG